MKYSVPRSALSAPELVARPDRSYWSRIPLGFAQILFDTLAGGGEFAHPAISRTSGSCSCRRDGTGLEDDAATRAT